MFDSVDIGDYDRFMSGVRSYSFREGDRSEYLAQFLLSAIGLCSSIPRPEDIGLDFSCSIADQEHGVLSFGYPFMVSIKSLSSPNIELPAPEKRRDQKHIEWLFRQDTPLFLGIVDKSEVSLRLYSLLPLWFIYYEGGLKCGSLTILPRVDSSDLSDVGRPKRGDELPALPGMYHYDVDVGHPVAEITIHSIKDEDRLRAAKNSLRIAIRYARLNLVHFQLGIPYFYWFAKTFPDGSALQPAYFCLSVPPEADHQERILGELAPSLICFALHYKAVGNAERLAAIGLLLSGLPREFFPLEVRDHLPEIFA